ncbi:MAG: hypothetical protein ABID61_04020 [Candidatus Micrarchaeota archaeon]
MAGGSLRDRIAAERKGIADARKGLDTTVRPVIRPPSDAGLQDGGGHAGSKGTPVPEPAKAPTPAPTRAPWADRSPEFGTIAVPVEAPPVEAHDDSRDTSVFLGAGSSRKVVVEGDALDDIPLPVARAPVEEAPPPRRRASVYVKPREPIGEQAEPTPVPARAPDLGADFTPHVPERPLDRFGMDEDVSPVAAEPDSAPTRIMDMPIPEPQSRQLKTVNFYLPGTKKKIVASCMLEYTGSKGDEYNFVLINKHNNRTTRENITLRVGDTPTSVNVRTKFGNATLDLSLDSVHKGTKRVVPVVKAEKLSALVESAKHYKTAEFWANLKIKPYIPEIYLVGVCAAVDITLALAGAGVEYLGALQPIAVVGLATVQSIFIGWSGLHRNTNFNNEAKALELPAEAPHSS